MPASMARVYAKAIGSDRRVNAICSLLRGGVNGEFAIVHQDSCAFSGPQGGARCTCVPSVWRVEWGKA